MAQIPSIRQREKIIKAEWAAKVTIIYDWKYSVGQYNAQGLKVSVQTSVSACLLSLILAIFHVTAANRPG